MMPPSADLLMANLELAVVLWAEKVANYSDEYKRERSRLCVDEIASKGDILQFGNGQGRKKGKKGEVAEVFNRLAEAVAIGRLQPGGITFNKVHWCTDHAACEAAQEQARRIVDIPLPGDG